MKISKEAINFNKQILMGEIGAIIGAQTFSHLSSEVFHSLTRISIAAVIGSMVGSSLWMFTRAYDMASHKKFSYKELAEDIALFTPVAFLLSCLIYYPLLFFLSKSLLMHHFLDHSIILSSVFISQLIAFLVLLIALNLYRIFLFKKTGRRL